MENTSFSVVLSVYKNDKPKYVKRALDSITTQQTLPPNEIILVVDGPIPSELKDLIHTYEKNPIFNIIWIPKNKGLGNALRIGVNAAKYDLVARMDADDISLPDRFHKQIDFLKKNPQCDLIGGQISEFIEKEDNIVGRRIVPIFHDEILKEIKKRCPFNHVSIMGKRSSIIKAGNYIDWHFNEDYYLWIRMAQACSKFANLPEILVNVRVGKDMYKRRGGWKYFTSEAKIQKYMLRNSIIPLPRYLYNVFGRFIIQVLMPNRVRGYVFQKLFRK